uniref:Probable DNA polymerase n=1 Tax=Amanita thiersii TaxID=235537 RepID=A0A5Q0N2D9_9AGAR|nr:DNA polymerase type B [Amanita thiersii]QFZ98734.1 DNA polymerase type B [Amanita thiersii]
MDIETITYKGLQLPISISLVNNDSKKLFFIDYNVNIDIEISVKKMWKELFKYLEKNCLNYKIIFIHNLGSFDGYFIYKYLSDYDKPEQVKTIIDQHNKFITISYLTKNKDKITWKDSYRIFSVSLNNLCKNYEVEGKLTPYKEIYNSIEIFQSEELLNEFKDYNLQESIALYMVLVKIQEIYILEYNVDISTILSTSTLSMKIFRSNFLKVKIPILKDDVDNFIRKGYFGGATDYYKCYGENLYYYDVNSLYPHSMCKPMPYEIIAHHQDMYDIELENLFGFCEAEISTPDTLTPLLPYKYQGKTIFPTGKWRATYFSEELKAVTSYGYKVTLIRGYEFSKIELFNSYIEHFYHNKQFAIGSERLIPKLQLNNLYGIFGRRKDLIETVNIYRKDIPKYITNNVIKNIITISD